MEIQLDWDKDFQEFQEILNSGIHPKWLYASMTNMILEPAYTGQGKQFFYTQDIIEASKELPFF
ncbi:hypothetical protein SSCHL_2240 [Staphylococcus schleiferi]|uniref:Uncharacterized protein n=1 Tax=Staphylococcus coagulans TaxID=74706 RepID=A0ABU1EXZ1_9STAP|nr:MULTISPECIES: hypothetical protein [Staphylococcus]NHA37379.1 hypothetical protein [Staphylococcus schleiferi]MBA8760847.1 hypothetical protein [Staphylococcus coagulans]MBA8762989.1 hypothetical protein [Staphylococcus coagulans]MBA8769543.1 hypothetical protein [Staphylococcus coagulans]MDR5602997.1 hypothetical protein [Staphylococcus coagulans]